MAGFSTVARPLTTLLYKGEEWYWTTDQEAAFWKLLSCLMSEPMLAVNIHGATTEVHKDACKFGLGGVQLQEQVDKFINPVM